MNFELLSVSGLLSLFKAGLLTRPEMCRVVDVIVSKIKCGADKLSAEEMPLFGLLQEMATRVKQLISLTDNLELPSTSHQSVVVPDVEDAPLNKTLGSSMRAAVLDFDLDLLNPANVQEPINLESSNTLLERDAALDVEDVSLNLGSTMEAAVLDFDLDLLNSANVQEPINLESPNTLMQCDAAAIVPDIDDISLNAIIGAAAVVDPDLDLSNSPDVQEPETRMQVGSGQHTVSETVSTSRQERGFKYFNLQGESSRHIKKYNTDARRLTFNFKNVGGSENPLVWLKNAFNELQEYILRGSGPADRVGLTIRNPNFSEKPVGISFRRVDQLSTDAILSAIERILQSNAQFFSNDVLSVEVNRVVLPVGYGRVHLKGFNFEEFCRRKVGIIVVPDNNGDNFCLAYALIIAIGFRTNDPSLNRLKIGLPILHERALELCHNSGVDLSNGGSYEHIRLFQNYLTSYTIVVYNSRIGSSTYFEGPREGNRTVLNLILENEHYNVITSLTSAFTTCYFCEHCKLRFSTREQHKRCPYTCPACHCQPPCAYLNNNQVCGDCNRNFRGRECFTNHKQNNLCKRLFKCNVCLYIVWARKGREHKCGYTFCFTCLKVLPTRHLCYMQKKSPFKPNKKTSDKILYVFYDLECMQETLLEGSRNSYVHEPNLCVAVQTCLSCIENENFSQSCNKCGTRLYVFRADPVKTFLKYIAQQARTYKVVALAHNMKGYDGCFILRELITDRDKWDPKIITNGTKIISITCGQIRFLDSLNFMPLPLSQLPKAFNFPEAKGYFPHLFNTRANQDYVGPLPEIKYYTPDQMSSGARSKFVDWYQREIDQDTVFDMKAEMTKYCKLDVQILAKACLHFRKIFVEQNGVHPFRESTTIASACSLVFRRRFLIDDTIGLIPNGGYRLADKQSVIAINWLRWVEHTENISITHAGKCREYRTPQGILVDGYCKNTNTIYEFQGCWWHGCELCFPQQTEGINGDRDKALHLKREHTEARIERLKSFGYNIVAIRECEFKRLMNSNENLKNFIENTRGMNQEPLDPREAFFGGRTNAAKLYYSCNGMEEKIMYTDICSLYPFVNKYCKYPIGHPKIHVGADACGKLDIATVDGLIKCRVLPPNNLYHPVLPCKMHNKLMFILCRTCGEQRNSNDYCNHNNQERSFVGTYVADELRKAVEKNYRVLEIYEIWEYKITQYNKTSRSGGLFAGYIDNFLKTKQECSGWPSSCITEAQKSKYVQDYFEKEGVQLDENKICTNPGLRYLAKLMLNSFWGKFGQRENLPQASIITNPESFFKLLTDPLVSVQSLVPIDDESVILNWNKHENDDSNPSGIVNVVIAAYTTAHARLQLYSYLEKLDRRVLYFDTDSVIFISKPGEWEPEKGNYLGQMTDELESYGVGSYISEFVSGGPKNYAYKIWSTNDQKHVTICKVKGITLNFENGQIINFDSIKDIVCNDNTKTLLVSNERKICRTSAFEVISRSEAKTYRYNYTKRRRLENNYDTLPYGYVVR